MRKNFGPQDWVSPMPVLVIGSYDINGKADAMTAAWGGQCGDHRIAVCISSTHKSSENINSLGEFSIAPATFDNVREADFVGLVSEKENPGKLEEAGLHAEKCAGINAPFFKELPLVFECRKISYDLESGLLIADIIGVSAEEYILNEEGKIDTAKLKLISFDPINCKYIRVSGKEFSAFVNKSGAAKIKVTVDNNKVIGPVKPLHGVNNAPYIAGVHNWMHYLGEAHISSVRLHDTCGDFGGTMFVDIPNIFPDFDADPNDPASYNFFYTDDLLLEIKKQGCETFYRLGVSIENDFEDGPVYRIYPPKDPEKWASICEHIIRHYNEGWANGYHLDIKYWEIWNEPDNEPEIDKNPMWRGTMEEFFELYRITANRLKNAFPDLKIGGYASCGFYSVAETKANAFAKVSDRFEYFTEFFLKFLDYITAPETRAPLDFCSWHSYADEDSTKIFAEFCREELDKRGLTDAESIFNEWNIGPHLRGTMCDGALVASMMITMADCKVDMMNYYVASVGGAYSGLFNTYYRTPTKAYYSLKAYGELWADGQRVSATADSHDVGVIASEHNVMLCNRTDETKIVNLNMIPSKVFMTDEERDYEEFNTPVPGIIRLSPFAVALVKY